MLKGCLLSMLVGLAGVAHADVVAVANFDNFPTGPSTFAAAGPAVTVTYPGIASFSGGVILGNATNLPGLGFATPPNAYGTAGFASPGYTNPLTITINPAFTADEVSFALLNGATIPSTYVVDAFSGATLVGTQTFTNVPSNLSSGFVLPDILATDITSVTIMSTTNDPNVNGWDFFIDSVAFNESIGQELNPVPEPSSLLLLATGLAGGLGAAYRRLRSTV